MRRILSYVAVCALGVLIGGWASAQLSVRAGRLYGQMLRLAFAAEEERSLSEAWRKGELPAALVHASCGVDLLQGRAFAPERSLWDITFPLMGAFASENVKYPADNLTHSEGLAKARLGVVWERLGREDLAKLYYADAAKLMGIRDLAEVKKAGLATISRDKTPEPPPAK